MCYLITKKREGGQVHPREREREIDECKDREIEREVEKIAIDKKRDRERDGQSNRSGELFRKSDRERTE